MGGLVVLLVFLLMLGGAKRFWDWLAGQAGSKKTTSQSTKKDPKPGKIDVLIKAMENEGYLGRVRLPDDELTYVSNVVISEMLDSLSDTCDLKWVLPEYNLRVRRMPEDAPDVVKNHYKWAVFTPTHIIGFNY